MARYIDADELKKQFCQDCGRMYDNLNCKEEECAVIDVVDMMPTIDVQPVAHAEWKEIKEYEHDKLPIVYECSECGYQYHTQKGGKFKHCPGCGAKMDEKEVK